MRATGYVVVALTAMAVGAAGCGSGGGNASGTTTAATSTSAASVLAGARAVPAGPARVDVQLRLDVKGSPSDPRLATLLGKPVSLTIAGVADSAARKADVTFALAAGPLTFDGALRQDGARGWLRFQGEWYRLPDAARSSSSSSPAPISRAALQRLVGRLVSPHALVRSPRLVGSEDVGGETADHVRGDLDLAALVRRLRAVSSGTDRQRPLPAGQVRAGVRQIQRYVKTSTVDLWVGRDDHTVRKLSLMLGGGLDDRTRQSYGIDSFTLSLTATQSAAASPRITAPPNPRPYSQLQQDLGGLGLLGGGG